MPQVVVLNALAGEQITAMLLSLDGSSLVGTAQCTYQSTSQTYSASFSGVSNGKYRVCGFAADGYKLFDGAVTIDSAAGVFIAGSIAVLPETAAVAANVNVAGFTSSGIEQLTAAITQNRKNITMPISTTIVLTLFDPIALSFASLGDLSGRSDLHFMVKSALTEADSAALLSVSEASGLTRVNGQAWGGSSSLGSLSVTNEALGTCSLAVDGSAMTSLPVSSGNGYFWAIKKKTSSGAGSRTMRQGRCIVENGVIRSNV